MDDELRDALYRELARVVPTPEAEMILRLTGFPLHRMPATELNRALYWAQVRHELDAGVSVNGEQALVRTMAREYPGNRVFQAAAESLRREVYPVLVFAGTGEFHEYVTAVRELDAQAQLLYVSQGEDAEAGQVAVGLTRELPPERIEELRHRLVAAGAAEDLEIHQTLCDHRPYLFEELRILGPEQESYVLEGVPSLTPVRDIAAAVLGPHGHLWPQDRTHAVVDHLRPDGGLRRLDPNGPLHAAGVRDGDTLNLYFEALAGGWEGPRHPPDLPPALPGFPPAGAVPRGAPPPLAALPEPEPPGPDWHLRADLPDSAHPGRDFGVTVSLVARDGTRAPAGNVLITLSATLSPGLSAPGGMHHELRYRPGTDVGPPAVHFPVRIHGLNAQEIRLNAWSGGTHLGTLVLPLTGTLTRAPVQTQSRWLPIAELAPRHDQVTLQVFSRRGSRTLQFQLLSVLNGYQEPEYLDLESDPGPLLRRMREDMRRLEAAETEGARKAGLHEARMHGVELWRELIPAPIKEQFWAVRDDMASFSVFAIGENAENIPWELLYPVSADPADERGHLVEEAPFSRYACYAASGRRPPRQIALDSPVFVLGNSPKDAHEELTALFGMLAAGDGRQPPVFSKVRQLTEWIEEGDGGLLHFAGDNAVDADGHSSFPLQDGAFRPLLLGIAEVRALLAGRSPLVFFNACGSARVGTGLTQLNGWAGRFMTAGASNFLGTQWAVRSDTARAFAEAFYQEFAVNRASIGRAVHQARHHLGRTALADASRLAYSLYGDPWTYAIRN